jgi:hypothetical protein
LRRGNGKPAPRGVDAGFALFRALSETTLQGREMLAALAGMSFGGVRDLYSTLGYDRVLTPQKLRDRYARGDIATRIVEAYPKATWRGGPELVEDEDPDVVTDFEEAWDSLAERLSVWSVLQRADVLCGLGSFSIVLIGAVGALETELPKLSGPEGVLYLAPYGPDEVTIDTYVDNTEDPRFGLPQTYRIRRSSAVNRSRGLDSTVHWTRVIHIADRLLDDRVNGDPLLAHVWNRLDDLDKVVGGGSESYWRRVHPGTILGVDPDTRIGEAEIKKLKEETDEFIHGMKRFLTLRGVEVDQLQADVSNFNTQVQSIISLISGATGIPQRILIGSERGELASTQDKENWNERVQDRRDTFGTPVVRQVVDRFVDHGVLPQPDQYDVRWPDIDDLTEDERAGVADKWSKLSAQAGGPVVDPEEIRDRVLRLPKREPKPVKEEEVRVGPPPPPAGEE